QKPLDVHGNGHDSHPDCPDDCLNDSQPVQLFRQSSAGKVWHEPIADSKECQDNGCCHGKMEMSCYPDRIMNDSIHLVGSVDDTARSSRYERDHPDERRKEAHIFPWQVFQPTEKTFESFLSPGILKCRKQ